MEEPPISEGGANAIPPPVLMGYVAKIVGSLGTCAWATPKHINNKSKINALSKLGFEKEFIRCFFKMLESQLVYKLCVQKNYKWTTKAKMTT